MKFKLMHIVLSILFLLLAGIIYVYRGIQKNTKNERIDFDGEVRTYKLYIPKSYHNAKEPVPLLINLHGHSGNSWQQMLYADFRSLADMEGFIMALPQGMTYAPSNKSYWNAYYREGNHNDIQFIESMIDTLIAEYHIDRNRVYVTGFSNGAAMCIALACDLQDKIAAIAPVSCTRTTEFPVVCNNSKPISVLMMHGTEDKFVKYGGGPLSVNEFISVSDEIEIWKKHNRTLDVPEVDTLTHANSRSISTVIRERYTSNTNDAEVLLYKIINGGHTWPGSPKWAELILANLGHTNQNIDVSIEIWNFFKRHRLPRENE